MKVFKYFVAVMLISVLCNTQPSSKKFAAKVCLEFSAEEKALLQEIVMLQKERVKLEYEKSRNQGMPLSEQAALQKQVNLLAQLITAKIEKSKENAKNSINCLSCKIITFLREYELTTYDALLSELKRNC